LRGPLLTFSMNLKIVAIEVTMVGTQGWNRMVKEFHLRNKYVSFTKAQIQDKESQLK
jgi:hypothetical protein